LNPPGETGGQQAGGEQDDDEGALHRSRLAERPAGRNSAVGRAELGEKVNLG